MNALQHYLRTQRHYWPLQRRLGYFFKRISYLDRALTHPSHGPFNNQRLEYLGDSVLELIVSENLYQSYPDVNEGTLTKLKVMSVNNNHLRSVALNLDISNFLRLGHGTVAKSQSEKMHADAVESVIGAIYLDGGHRHAERFVKRFVLETLPTLEETQQHPKTALANWASKQGFPYPTYETIESPKAPVHLHWTIKCTLDKLAITRIVTRKSRKEAEKLAAEEILYALGVYSREDKV